MQFRNYNPENIKADMVLQKYNGDAEVSIYFGYTAGRQKTITKSKKRMLAVTHYGGIKPHIDMQTWDVQFKDNLIKELLDKGWKK